MNLSCYIFSSVRGVDDPALWAGKVGNSWRTTDDINDTWARSGSRPLRKRPFFTDSNRIQLPSCHFLLAPSLCSFSGVLVLILIYYDADRYCFVFFFLFKHDDSCRYQQ